MIDFNKIEREVIAEFIYSYYNKILLKSDIVDLVNVLSGYGLIDDIEEWLYDAKLNINDIVPRLFKVLRESTNEKQINKIMYEYKINNK